MHIRRTAITLAALSASHATAQQTVFSQAPDTPAQAAVSSDAPGGAYTYDDQRLAENVTIAGDATISAIRFWGGSETVAEADRNTLGFRLHIYELGQPRPTLVHERRVGRGFAKPINTGTTFGEYSASLFLYEWDLEDEPVQLTGDRAYAVSIAAITMVPAGPAGESWAWASAQGDGVIHRDRFDGAGLTSHSAGVSGLALELVGDMDAPACLADVNHDGSLTPADFSAWIAAFHAGSPECDQNRDGLCNPTDFSAWIANFNAGC